MGSQRTRRSLASGPGVTLKMGASLKHRVEYLGVRLATGFIGRMPTFLRVFMGRRLGDLAFSVLRIRRRVTLENLRYAFPEWDESRRLEVAQNCYRHFGVVFLDFTRLPRMSPAEFEAHVEIENEEALRALTEGGRGGVLASAHIGNWEVLGARVACAGYPIWVAVRKQSNRLVDQFVTQAREATGMRVLKTDEGFRRMLRTVRNGEFITLLFDQDAGRNGVFLPFFGRPASTSQGPARFARMAKAPIVMGFAIRQPDGRYRARLIGPFELPAEEEPAASRVGETSGDSSNAEKKLLEEMVGQLEDVIRSHPEQWFWMHRRWKTQPASSGGEDVT